MALSMPAPGTRNARSRRCAFADRLVAFAGSSAFGVGQRSTAVPVGRVGLRWSHRPQCRRGALGRVSLSGRAVCAFLRCGRAGLAPAVGRARAFDAGGLRGERVLLAGGVVVADLLRGRRIHADRDLRELVDRHLPGVAEFVGEAARERRDYRLGVGCARAGTVGTAPACCVWVGGTTGFLDDGMDRGSDRTLVMWWVELCVFPSTVWPSKRRGIGASCRRHPLGRAVHESSVGFCRGATPACGRSTPCALVCACARTRGWGSCEVLVVWPGWPHWTDHVGSWPLSANRAVSLVDEHCAGCGASPAACLGLLPRT